MLAAACGTEIEGFGDVGRRVAVGASAGDAVFEDAAEGGAEALRRMMFSARFETADGAQDLRCADVL